MVTTLEPGQFRKVSRTVEIKMAPTRPEAAPGMVSRAVLVRMMVRSFYLVITLTEGNAAQR